MSGSGKAGNGHGNNRRTEGSRRSSKRRPNDSLRQENDNPVNNKKPARSSAGDSEKKHGHDDEHRFPRKSGDGGHDHRFHRGGHKPNRGERNRYPHIERPKWTPPKINTEPLPVPNCPWCGKEIRDIAQAMTDKDTGVPVHFDCVAARIAGGENLERGESITYIGGGRFGIVSFGDRANNTRESSHAAREFSIRKIIEWESKDRRADWRSVICDHYLVT